MAWKVWYQSHGEFAKRYAAGMLTIEPGRRWSGILGGNDKLMAELQQALPVS
jgi:hypothetical protein